LWAYTVQGFIGRLLEEISPCGWRRYSSAFSSAAVAMKETGNFVYFADMTTELLRPTLLDRHVALRLAKTRKIEADFAKMAKI